MRAVLLSGGIDSAVCLAMAVRSHGAENVTAVHVHYSQPHSAESWHAARLAKRYHVPLATVHASPWGQLPEPTASNDPMVIPGRNALLIALAAALVPRYSLAATPMTSETTQTAGRNFSEPCPQRLALP